MRWWLVLLLVPHVGGVTYYAADADGLVLVAEPLDGEPHVGDAETERVTWAILGNTTAPMLNGTWDATAAFDSSAGGASVTVSMTVDVNGTRVMAGAAQNLTVVAGAQDVSWNGALDTATGPGEVWWNITADGPLYLGLQLRVDGTTNITLPEAWPEPGPDRSLHLLEPGPMRIQLGDARHAIDTYTWPRNETPADLSWNVTHVTGSVEVTVMGPESLFQRVWTASDAGNITLNGTAEAWTVVVERIDFEGNLEMDARAEERLAPRARSTPLPWFLALVGIAAWSPRSRKF